MNSKKSLLAHLVAGLSVSILIPGMTIPAKAVQLSDGSVHFDRSPSLIEPDSTASQANRNSSVYYFTINLPADAGETLAGVMITPEQSEHNSAQFSLDDIEAFLGTPEAPGDRLELQKVDRVENPGGIQVTFAQPVTPGTTVTVGLKPRHSRQSGTYRFGVTAFPTSANPASEFLGYRQLSFSGRDSRPYPYGSRNSGFPTQGVDNRAGFWDLPSDFDIRLRHRN
jgi:hypothetical protein